MPPSNALRSYQQQAIRAASPAELIDKLYGIGVTAAWDRQGWGLAPASSVFGGRCTPNIQPDPEPEVPAPEAPAP